MLSADSVAGLTIMLTAKRHYLLWCFNISYWRFYIDAHSGVIRESYPNTSNLSRSMPSMPGGDIEVTPERLDFRQEQIDSHGDYPKQEVVITNTVGRILVIRDLVLQGESFTIEEPSLSLPLPVPAGGEAVISIGFSPSVTEKVTGILSIESTDKDSPVVEVVLEGGGGEASTDSQSDKKISSFPYGLSTYGSSFSPFFLYDPSFVSINPKPLFLSMDYLFPWNYFNNLPENLSFNFLCLPPNNLSNNLFDYSFYPTLEHYNYLTYDLFLK